MKKSELIALLSSIEDDPEIYLWNGMAEDIMAIDKDIHKDELIRLKLDSARLIADSLNIKDNIKRSKFIKDIRKFEYHNYRPDNMDIYETKDILVLQPKLSNKSYCDKVGMIRY